MTRTTWRRTLAQVAWLLPLAMLLIAMAACGPTVEESELTPQERLDNAAERMGQVTSLDFTLSHEEGHTPLMLGVVLQGAEGSTKFPDQASMRVDALISALNTFLEMEIIVDGENATMTDPLSGTPLALPANQLPFNLHGLGATLGGILLAIEDPAFTDSDTLDGVASQGIGGTISGADIKPLIPGADATLQQDIEVWVGEDNLIRRVRIAGKVLGNDTEPVVRILTFTNFDEAQPSASAP